MALLQGEAIGLEGKFFFQLDRMWAANTNTNFWKTTLGGGLSEAFLHMHGNGSIQGQIVPIQWLSPAVVTAPEIALWKHFRTSVDVHQPIFTLFILPCSEPDKYLISSSLIH